ncbi:G-D-S-L family lipolytic protein [Sediminibacterium roseum]|uniref:G-D-S-L family lipolytic protein n=1 Tax=Sediminibacterium roseum TaxID=1978412 RepID=A0ABW9ZYV9_9BACT|nr:GDSL-type esterase/lipase family protein [Sediminibacterium roseum]NCI50907.1 G-D-S-L family lipolytic protein [Sediminibacterium roseum]
MSSKLILLGLFVASMILFSFRPDKKKKVLFFGDSITQAGVRPGGYIKVMDSMLQQQGLSDKFELIGAGIGGDKIYDLYLRMEKDVLEQKPDIVVIYVGVNDVWHKSSSGTGTDYPKFGRFYEAVVNKLQSAGCKVIVCTPAVIGEKTDNSNMQDGDLNHYSNWIREYSKRANLPLVDLRAAFISYNLKNNLQNKESGILTTDRVHLTPAGNIFVAEQMWNVIKTVN